MFSGDIDGSLPEEKEKNNAATTNNSETRVPMTSNIQWTSTGGQCYPRYASTNVYGVAPQQTLQQQQQRHVCCGDVSSALYGRDREYGTAAGSAALLNAQALYHHQVANGYQFQVAAPTSDVATQQIAAGAHQHPMYAYPAQAASPCYFMPPAYLPTMIPASATTASSGSSRFRADSANENAYAQIQERTFILLNTLRLASVMDASGQDQSHTLSAATRQLAQVSSMLTKLVKASPWDLSQF